MGSGKDVLINLHALERHGTGSLGPGRRYVVWVQGCPFACHGCATPEAQDVESGFLLRVGELASDIAASGCTGLTVSGGEPMLQAASLTELLRRVREARPEMTVIVFTGFEIETLPTPEAHEVVGLADLIIDGPYRAELNDGTGLRGSTNQRMHFITGRLLPWRDQLMHGPRSLHVTFSPTEGVAAAGIPLGGNSKPSSTTQSLSTNQQNFTL